MVSVWDCVLVVTKVILGLSERLWERFSDELSLMVVVLVIVTVIE